MRQRRRAATVVLVVLVGLAGAAAGYALGGAGRHRAPALTPIRVPGQRVSLGQLRSPVTVPQLRTPTGG